MSKSWNGGKSGKSDPERTRIQKIAHENKRLKQEISKLRKTILRMDSGWCPGCLDKYEGRAPESTLPEPCVEKPKKIDRVCHKCNEGELVLTKYYKVSETWYYRRCSSCDNRTRGKRYTPDVKD